MVNKIKIKLKKDLPIPISSYWFCDVCKKNYAKKGKYQHLKTDFHKRNLQNPSPRGHLHPLPLQRVRRCKNPEDYVENKLIKLFVGGNILDDPISDSNLPQPLAPTKYKPIPKPRRKRLVPKPLPRILPPRISKRVRENVKKLIDEITPYYKPETISEFKRKLKFIPKDDDVDITEKSKALKGNVKSFEVSIVNKYDPSVQLNNARKAIFKLLMELLTVKRGFKFNAVLKARLSKRTEQDEDGTIYREPYFNAGPFTVTNSDDIEETIHNAIERILELIAGWFSEGSGWIFELVLLHCINIVSYFPLKGKSYIKLPEELSNPKKTLVNPKNEDNRCFLWCHIRHLNPLKRNPQRITKEDKELVKKLDYTGVTFPVTIKDIPKIEKQNQINVNVFGYDKGAYPIRISKAKFKDHLELLWIVEQDEEQATSERQSQKSEKENSHYVLIKNFNQFMTSFTKHKDRKYFCMSCLHCCSSERTLEMHKQDCLAINGTQAIRTPTEGSKIYFQNHQKMLPAPFVIYADFEAITEKN